MVQNAVRYARGVVDAERVRDRHEGGVGDGDRLVVGELPNEPVRHSGMRLAEPGGSTVRGPT